MSPLRYSGIVHGTPRGVFMTWFFCGAYANIIALCTATNTRYSNREFNTMKWWGALAGFALNSIMAVLVFLLFDYAPWGGVVLITYYISLIIFHIVYRKIIAPRRGDSHEEAGIWHSN